MKLTYAGVFFIGFMFGVFTQAFTEANAPKTPSQAEQEQKPNCSFVEYRSGGLYICNVEIDDVNYLVSSRGGLVKK